MEKRQSLILFFIFILLVASLFVNLNTLELRAEEPRRAVVSMEMIFNNDLAKPSLMGEPYYNKPPLFNWLLIGFFYLFNSYNEWVVRLPALLAFLLTGLVLYLLCRRYLSKEIGMLSSLFFLTSADIYFYGTSTSGEIDLFYALVVMLQLAAIFHFSERNQFLQLFLWSYLFTVAGFLTKGLPSLIFQAFTLLSWLWYKKEFKQLFSLKHFAGILFFAVLTGAYFYLYSIKGGDATIFALNLVNESVQKSGISVPIGKTLLMFFTFPFNFIQFLLPWSLLVFLLFKTGRIKSLFQQNLVAFSIVFLLINIIVYWLSGETRSRYLYMFFPFAAIILAVLFIKYVQENTNLISKISKVTTVILAIAALLFFVLPFLKIANKGDSVAVESFIIAASFTGLLVLHLKQLLQPVFTVALIIIVARLAMGLIYAPLHQASSRSMIYRAASHNILKIVKNEKVFLYGTLDTVFNSPTVASVFPGKEKFLTPQPVPYQLPYYLTKDNKYVMRFTSTAAPNQYYLAYEDVTKGLPINIHYRFMEKFLHKEMVLFKLK